VRYHFRLYFVSVLLIISVFVSVNEIISFSVSVSVNEYITGSEDEVGNEIMFHSVSL